MVRFASTEDFICGRGGDAARCRRTDVGEAGHMTKWYPTWVRRSRQWGSLLELRHDIVVSNSLRRIEPAAEAWDVNSPDNRQWRHRPPSPRLYLARDAMRVRSVERQRSRRSRPALQTTGEGRPAYSSTWAGPG